MNITISMDENRTLVNILTKLLNNRKLQSGSNFSQSTVYDITPDEVQTLIDLNQRLIAEADKAETERMKNFRSLKEKHPDAVLWFREGDFYECYHDDAKLCAKALGLTLTGSDTIPTCAFPHHRIDTYLPKLIRAGLRIAICDPLEAPKKKHSNK